MKKTSLTLSLLLAVSAAFVTSSSLRAEDAPAPAADAPAAPASYDFGDSVSWKLTTKAWNYLQAGDLAGVEAFAGRCISMYEGTAISQQAGLSAPVPTTDKAAVQAQWALNDVGTCYYILGQAYEKAGKTDEAIKAYKALVDKLSYAQCWDPKGWFWGPADAAKGRIKALEFDAASK